MFFFSKSKYCLAWQCPKLLWLSKYKPELKPYDPSLQARFDEGNVIGDLAMGLLGDFKEVTCYKTDGKLDLNKMKELTEQYINDGVENICEASFDWNGFIARLIFCIRPITDMQFTRLKVRPTHQGFMRRILHIKNMC